MRMRPAIEAEKSTRSLLLVQLLPKAGKGLGPLRKGALHEVFKKANRVQPAGPTMVPITRGKVAGKRRDAIPWNSGELDAAGHGCGHGVEVMCLPRGIDGDSGTALPCCQQHTGINMLQGMLEAGAAHCPPNVKPIGMQLINEPVSGFHQLLGWSTTKIKMLVQLGILERPWTSNRQHGIG
jgi:hypothetical protein